MWYLNPCHEATCVIWCLFDCMIFCNEYCKCFSILVLQFFKRIRSLVFLFKWFYTCHMGNFIAGCLVWAKAPSWRHITIWFFKLCLGWRVVSLVFIHHLLYLLKQSSITTKKSHNYNAVNSWTFFYNLQFIALNHWKLKEDNND